MIIVGLIVGPAIGLLLSDLLFRSASIARWQGFLATLLVLVFLLFVPVFALELKIGLIAGCLLGLLLASTRFALDSETA